ncbi:DUF3592 domain-containing protein [Amycolatopsis sp. OK19-0408]|uniref:DUF3592 domain-containing protein n=1 Tax=Amycolatopsis iheyensis TaxID=2945988 RepID=A0A9X2N8F7_9PSEU|nr:DUF3592 domain-containing protein [Amycolatopsis iheyensis]MCR6482803.1 DUF3592 domain-containing protein [Amycolatopsis iheyensis]
MEGDSAWLPPEGDEGPPDPAACTAKLRVFGRRALVVAVVWLLAAGGVFAGLIAYERPAGQLLEDGVRATGTVLRFDDDPRAIRLSFDVRGELRYATVPVHSGRRYIEGRTLTVIYDPANLSRVRTVLEDGVDPRPAALLWLLALGVLVCAGFSLVASLRWRRRHRAVVRTGWRAASVTVQPDYPVRALRHLPDILVEYRDGSRAELRASTSSHGSTRMRHQPERPAWVGGSGPDMVVLFSRGDLRRPYAVPAFGRKPRAEHVP